MKITIQIECESGAEAAVVLQKLQDSGQVARTVEHDAREVRHAAAPEPTKGTANVASQPPVQGPEPAAVTVEQLKDYYMKTYLQKPGCSAKTGNDIMVAHGAVGPNGNGSMKDANPAQIAAIYQAMQAA